MKINRNNYEAYFLDFAEGRLAPGEEEEIRAFLSANPDLEEEFNMLTLFRLEPEQMIFPRKNALRKNFPESREQVTTENFDMYCIAYLEKDLSREQSERFEQYLSDHPEISSEWIRIKRTFLQPKHVAFPAKDRLKKRKARVIDRRLWMPLAAAATLALMLVLTPSVRENPVEMAVTDKPVGEQERNLEVDPRTPAVNDPAAAGIRMIRSRTHPVPVSSYKKETPQENTPEPNTGKETTEAEREPVRIAGLDLASRYGEGAKVKYDRIVMQPVPPVPANSGTLLTRARQLFTNATTEAMEEEDALIWSLASAGLKGINRIRENDAEFYATRDAEGAISGISIKSRFLNVTAPLNREE